MKKLLLVLLVLNAVVVCSQNGNLTGTIVDAKTKLPLSYVNVVCKNAKLQLVTGGITNNNGKFTIKKLPLEKLTVEFQFIGYKTIKKVVVFSSENNAIELDKILLEEDATMLEDVEVQAETSTVVQKIDRKVINVGKDLSSAGTNAMQLMQNIPSVNVNMQSGTISLRGNENVRILVDGKPSNLSANQILKQIPSASVKSVELITNPSVKYNPEGMSGIINIVLKKNTQVGFNGSITAGIIHGINTRPSGNINLNYRTGKFNFYGSYNTEIGKYETKSELHRTDVDLLQHFDFIDDSKEHTGKIGVDVYLDDKNTLSLYTNQSFIKTDFHTATKTFLANSLLLDTPNLSVFDIHEGAYNLDYKLLLDDAGEELEFEATYTKTKNPQNDFNRELLDPTNRLFNYTNNITNNSDLWLFNLDYVKPISETAKIEVGLEARTQKTFNQIITNQEVETGGVPATAPRGNTNFNYDRDIYSTYINYNKDFSKFSLQAGLRFEQFTVNGLFSNTQQASNVNYNDEIFSVYPSAYLTYYASDKNEFQIGYSRRVDRPSIEQVSPIQEWTSPLAISVGNEFLNPQFTNSLEFNYTRNLNTGYISIGSFYRRISDQIGRNISTDPANPDRQIISYENYNASNSYGFEIYSSFKPTKWWTLNPSSDLYIQDRNGIVNTQNITVKNTVFNARMSNSFKVSKDFSLQLSGIYQGKSENVQFTIEPYYMINAGAKLTVLDGNGAITVNGTDIFDTVKLDFSSTQPYPQKGFYTFEISTIYVGFTYNFGSSKYKARGRKERDKNETEGSGGIL